MKLRFQPCWACRRRQFPSLRPLPAALIRKRTSQLLRMGAHARNRSLIPAVWFTPERNQKPEMSSAGRPAHSPRAFQAGQSRGSGRHTVRPGMSLHTMESSFLHTAADCTQCQHKCRKKCCAQSAWRERRSISCDREQRTWASPSGGAPETEAHALHRTLSGSVSQCCPGQSTALCLPSGAVWLPGLCCIRCPRHNKKDSRFSGVLFTG